MRWVLDHFGLARPYRFERTLLALVALIVLIATIGLALGLWYAGELKPGTLRATYFLYLVGLVLAALLLLRWPKLAMALVALAAIELGLGIATRLLRHLVTLARKSGIREFEAFVLPGNSAMLGVFERSGLAARVSRQEGQLRVKMRL